MTDYTIHIQLEDKLISINTFILKSAMASFLELCEKYSNKIVWLEQKIVTMGLDDEDFTETIKILAIGNLTWKMPLEEVTCLSARAFNVAKKNHCNTIGDLWDKVAQVIVDGVGRTGFRNCGNRTWEEFLTVTSFLN